MYDLDDDFMKSYDPKKAASKKGIPFFPYASGVFGLVLKSVKQDKSPTKGKYFEFKFLATKSNNELVVPGAAYISRFYQGASEVTNNQCWANMLPILAAAMGQAGDMAFDAPAALSEFVGICKTQADGTSAEMDFPLVVQRKMEAARPDKTTGKVAPKNLDDNGQPKFYPRDVWTTGA